MAKIPNPTPRRIETTFRMTGERVEPPKPTTAATPPHQKAALGGAFHRRLRMFRLLDILNGYPSPPRRKRLAASANLCDRTVGGAATTAVYLVRY